MRTGASVKDSDLLEGASVDSLLDAIDNDNAVIRPVAPRGTKFVQGCAWCLVSVLSFLRTSLLVC